MEAIILVVALVGIEYGVNFCNPPTVWPGMRMGTVMNELGKEPDKAFWSDSEEGLYDSLWIWRKTVCGDKYEYWVHWKANKAAKIEIMNEWSILPTIIEKGKGFKVSKPRKGKK